MLFDTHAHLNDEQIAPDLQDVVDRARGQGVTRIVVPGVDVASSERAIAIAEQYDGVYAAVGIHPESAKDVPASDYDRIRALSAHPKVVAIGEIGLDYYWDAAPRDEQKAVLRTQLQLAREAGLPVVIHNRDATEDTVTMLEQEYQNSLRGVMHCFTGSYEIALRCIKFGFYISFGGPVTFKNAKNVREVCARIPDSSLLVETDSPYLAPDPYRGKRNEPAHVRRVAEKLAEVREQTLETVANYTTQNALTLFSKIR